MDKNINEILKLDAISEVEKSSGKHHSEFNEFEMVEAILKQMAYNDLAKNKLKNSNDTYSHIIFDEFIKLISDYGFKEAYSNEREIIYYYKSKGLILYAEKYLKSETINSGKIYGEIKAKTKDDENFWGIINNLSTGGCIERENMIFETSYDIREGLFNYINTLELYGNFQPKWIETNRFLWFLNYDELKQKDYDYKKITNEKIKLCNNDINEIIGVI